MASKNIQTSQQQGQDVTIGTQGNEDQRTPQGEGIGQELQGEQDSRHIPNQEKSSATNQEQHRNGGGQQE